MLKILLIGINSKFIHSNLAIRYLKAYTADLNYNCNILEFSINDRIERVLEEILCEKPDLVAFSCYIWNIDYIKQLASLIKLIDDKIKILYGGPEVSYDSEKFLKENIGEYVIEGEGEETYREYVKTLLQYKEPLNIKGLYYKSDKGISYGGKRELMDMNKLAFPYNLKDNLENKIVYYEASRGCPFNCKYCLSSTIHGVRFLSLERVKKDLKFLIDKKVKLIKFVDRTFNCNSKFAMSLWEYLISIDTETTFHFEISADILNEDQLKLLAKAPKGRFQFEVGVQTTNNEVLKNINRFVAFEDIKKQVVELNKLGNIKQHLDLIAGLPGEDFQSFKKSFNDLYSIGPDEIQLGFLKLLKGSPMKEEAQKWGIVYSPYTPYEVLKTKDISYEELLLLKRVEAMIDKYYNSQKFTSILKYFIPKFESAFDFYLSLGGFFYDKGYFSRSLSSTDYYKVFLEFNSEVLNNENAALKEIVKFDYLKFNRKKWLPEFLERNIGKNTERIFKEAIKNEIIEVPFINYHIEDFNIDIIKFINNGEINGGIYYLIFDENNCNNILDVTYVINKEKLLNQ
ncbi:B12-binding domain-containing radical SAM protein [Clostridium caldaquaticum]|uniref:B12-binding domain-containing radical SAM protein n=1 Tax=Clostridium caldaquaticum TaxID=2940653 RepID=UPI002077019C|nr:B12-binding domain-containing radical SAM protein [Clostridium caldaquaticum]